MVKDPGSRNSGASYRAAYLYATCWSTLYWFRRLTRYLGLIHLRSIRSLGLFIITSPLRNVSYALKGGGKRSAVADDVIALDASAAADVKQMFWFDGNSLIGVRPVADGALGWRPSTAGVHFVRVVDDHGRAAEREVEIAFTR